MSGHDFNFVGFRNLAQLIDQEVDRLKEAAVAYAQEPTGAHPERAGMVSAYRSCIQLMHEVEKQMMGGKQ